MKAYWTDGQATIYHGDVLAVLRELPAESVHCVVTSPPYWGLRDYGVGGQFGLEPTSEAYVARMVEVFGEVRRVLRDDGTLWLNVGDSYAGSGKGPSNRPEQALDGISPIKRNRQQFAGGQAPTEWLSVPAGIKGKDLVGIPWMLAFALRADGWYLRSEIIWHKPNPMPESVADRPTKAHEQLFLLSKRGRYYYDGDAILEPRSRDWSGGKSGGTQLPQWALPMGANQVSEPRDAGRNKRSVWTIATEPYPEAHFATFPTALVKPCILAGSPEGGVVLDPFLGSGTTALVAKNLGRRAIGIDLNAEYLEMAVRRCGQMALGLSQEVLPLAGGGA